MNDNNNNDDTMAWVGLVVSLVILVWVLIVLWNVKIPVGG